MESKCPHCGYCPTCGRANWYQFYPWPVPYVAPAIPTWFQNTAGAAPQFHGYIYNVIL